jgi:lysophospholipase L1-like esterase
VKGHAFKGTRLGGLSCRPGLLSASFGKSRLGDDGESLRGEPPQADRLALAARRGDVRLIVVTAGANDVGFGELVVECALD